MVVSIQHDERREQTHMSDKMVNDKWNHEENSKCVLCTIVHEYTFSIFINAVEQSQQPCYKMVVDMAKFTHND